MKKQLLLEDILSQERSQTLFLYFSRKGRGYLNIMRIFADNFAFFILKVSKKTQFIINSECFTQV